MNSEHTIQVAFVGNPNCGKTTLFNALTGANLKVANWPGVTVEKKEGTAFYKGQKINLIDTPGIYSLTSYSIEEKVTRNCVMEDDIDVIVNVVDASSLERNLISDSSASGTWKACDPGYEYDGYCERTWNGD